MPNLDGLILNRGVDIFRHGPDVSATFDKNIRRVWGGVDNDLERIRGPVIGRGAKAHHFTRVDLRHDCFHCPTIVQTFKVHE